MPNNNLENPFKQSEDWQSWFKLDKTYLKHFRESLNDYLKLHNLNLIKNNYMPANSILTWITKHALLAIIIGLAILSTITASAAQIFLPPELKPTRILNIEKSSSSSQSSIQASSVSSSANSSSISSVSSTKTSSVATEQPKTQTYINEYFPDFKLVYPEDWKFSTETSDGSYKGLANRFVYLTKNSYKITVQLTPFQIGCGGGGTIKSTTNLTNGLKRFIMSASIDQVDNTQPGTVGYGTNAISCPYTQQILTNIKASNFPEYINGVQPVIDGRDKSVSLVSTEYVVYGYWIETYKNNNTLLENDPIIPEIDQIISQSVFK
jgi:hypothetical protein